MTYPKCIASNCLGGQHLDNKMYIVPIASSDCLGSDHMLGGSITTYAISDLWQFDGFQQVFWFPLPMKLIWANDKN